MSFHLRRVELSGPNVEAASVEFRKGLNVIVGPSDTGKSYIVELIDFALGRGDVPRSIPHAEGYRDVELVISAGDKSYSLTRNLRGGGVGVVGEGIAARQLKEKHDANNDDNISRFLLELCGLDGRMLRNNARGVTRMVSFRDVARLVIVSEESVIGSGSPVRSGHRTTRTVEDSLFRYLLTGVDDSTVVVQKEDAKVSRGKKEGRIEVLEQLLDRVHGEIGDLDGQSSQDAELKRALAAIDDDLESIAGQLGASEAGVTALEESRVVLWGRLRKSQSK